MLRLRLLFKHFIRLWSNENTRPPRRGSMLCMQQKLIWFGLAVGSALGSYLPVLWGESVFSMTSVLLSAVGGIFGIWLGYKVGR